MRGTSKGTKRREFLKYASAAGVTLGVAGCSGIFGGGEEEPTPTETETPTEEPTEEPTDTPTEEPTEAPPEELPEPEVVEKTDETFPNASHFGSYEVHVKDGVATRLSYYDGDYKPNVKGPGVRNRTYAPDRIKYPMKRKGWQPGGGGDTSGRGADEFVRISWDEALTLVADEMTRVKNEYGNESIHGLSIWAGGGSFHDPGGPVYRLLSLFGGFTTRTDNYSNAALSRAMPYSLGKRSNHGWMDIIENTDVILWLGGDPAVAGEGGVGAGPQIETPALIQSRDAGVEHIWVDPYYTDSAKLTDGEHLPIVPGTDNALLSAMAYVMLDEGLHDQDFIDEYVVGFEPFEEYVMGDEDGQPKTPEWAEQYTGISAGKIRELTRKMTNNRSIITAGYGIQRSQYGEQFVRMHATIAAMIGQIGLPGGGISTALHRGSPGIHTTDKSGPGSLPVPSNPVDVRYPACHHADLYLEPGKKYPHDGEIREYPDIKMAWMAGTNTFSIHQDTNKLLKAWRQPETIVVNEPWWTPTAEHADIVLPVAWNLERDDITADGNVVLAMKKAIDPLYESKSDWQICAELSAKLGVETLFTEGKSEMEWLETLYQVSDVPLSFDEFWEQGRYEFDTKPDRTTPFQDFREDPEANPLGTPSGKIEIYSEQLAGYGYDDVPAFPKFMEWDEYLGSSKANRFPLHMNNPHVRHRLHSQADNVGLTRKWGKISGHEPVWIHPDDARTRGIEDGDVVRVFNDRGQALGGAKVTKRVRPSTIVFSYGAWYEPENPGTIGTLDLEGTCNNLNHDNHTSSLAQGPATKDCLVEVEKYGGA
jgi:molybdopterin guanine dinucleotide-containing S/N-oxide reductase-like protein